MDVSYLLKGAVFLVAGLLAACGGGSDDDDDGGTADVIAPEITLIDANPLDLLVGDTYADPGATASDNVDGDITSNIVVAGDTVDTANVGAYVVTYDVSDAAGNPATQVTRTVNVAVVTDTVPPEITLLGADPLNLLVGDSYTDPGTTALDNVDGDITSNIVVAGDTVDTATVGSYAVTYDVSDAAGNPATQMTRTVNVSVVGTDTVPPVITLNGANPLDLLVGDSYTDPGATALDNVDGDITGNIVVAGDTVDTATVGSYAVTYNVSDTAGNPAVQLTRTVNVGDDTPPVITLLGTDPLDLLVGDTYTDPGVTATDDIDGDITSRIVVAGDTVDTAVAGTYVVTYDVSDLAGNFAVQLTRTVNVVSGVNDPPVINNLSISPDPAYINSAATFSWDVSDANGDTLTCLLDVENDGTNDYTINDCVNNTSQLHTYTVAGDYTAKLTVDDGVNSPVVTTLNFTVIAPLSTDVSVNGPAVAGERVLYTITVGNTTSGPIEDVVVSFVVPAELSFNRGVDAEPNASCTAVTCGATTESAWNLETLAAGESRTITINALVNAATLNGVTIALPVTFGAAGISNVQINKTVDVFNTPSADLALSASTDPVVANETFTYQLDFGNTSGGDLTTVELRAFLPAGVTVNSISDGGAEASTGVVVWNEASLSAGTSVYREITVIADGAAAGDILKLSAELTHDGGLEIDNRSEFAVSVAETAGIASLLSVDIAATPQPVASGGILAYTITVTNGYGLPLDGVSVQFRVPAELSFNRGLDAEPNASCTAVICGATTESAWNLGTMAAGASQIITINATVAASLVDGTLIVTPIRVTATDMEDTINLQHTTVIDN
ncbi:MAG: DUF5011 domain-containing protein [Gammaproteobacteria bacterium]|nr:DUF5011 domain-containing protein [Gammaproteobacteria bacterium]